MSKKFLKVGDTIYRVWIDSEGPRGEAYIIESKLSDYLVKARNREGKESTLSYFKDNIITNKSNAIKIHDILKNEWNMFLNNEHKPYYTPNKFIHKRVEPGDSVVILNEDDNKTLEIRIVKSQLSYTPQLGSGSLKNSIKYKTEIKEFSNIDKNEISENAPIAKALIGKKKNDLFSYACPDGQIISGKIIQIK